MNDRNKKSSNSRTEPNVYSFVKDLYKGGNSSKQAAFLEELEKYPEMQEIIKNSRKGIFSAEKTQDELTVESQIIPSPRIKS
jgi:hypothetical protein